MADDAEGSAHPAGRGIAPSERVVLLAFGGLTAFVGFVLLLLNLPLILRLGVGLPVTFVGVALCSLAVRSASRAEQADLTPSELLAIERLALFPLAGLTSAGAVAVLVGGSIVWYVRLFVSLGCLVLTSTFWALIIRNRLPERLQQPPPDRTAGRPQG
ncbi:MAG: hypothetical protein R2755_23295 [Acidimicrobiales bacterium]